MARPIVTLAGLAGLLAVASCAEQGDDMVMFCQRVAAHQMSDGVLGRSTKAKAVCSPVAAYRGGMQILGYARHRLAALHS